MSKGLGKYIAAFVNFDEALIILSTTSGSISIALIASIFAASVGKASVGFRFLVQGIRKKPFKTTQNKKKRQNKIC